MKKYLAPVLAATMLFMAGCSDETDTPTTEDYLIETTLDQPELKADEVPTVASADKAVWTSEVNHFGLTAMDRLSEGGNLLISPASLHSALAMAAAGADGNTYQEFAKVLNFGADRDVAEKLAADMQLTIRYDGQNANSHFVMANNLWVDQKVKLAETFKETMRTVFKAPVQVCNFIDYAAYVVDSINDWLKKLASGIAPKLTEKVENIQFMLISATSFEAKWAHPFSKSKTEQRSFKGKSKDVLIDFMHLIYDFEYYESVEKGYQAVVIPYMDDVFDMVIILPNDVSNAKNALSQITAEDFGNLHLDTPEYRLLDLSIPKFEISYDLTPSEIISRLKNIGIKEAFSEGLANFKILSPSYNVFIDSFLHQAVIAIDESGSNTTAATEATEDKPADGATKFEIDHAFAFAIVHRSSGALVYLGVVNDL
ncbi:MAG: serpin family protein [Proteobacteria bacterium]|nr:serpin family protein [Pseudomonadota bacterium]